MWVKNWLGEFREIFVQHSRSSHNCDASKSYVHRVEVVVALLLIQFLDYAPGKASENSSSPWTPACMWEIPMKS